MRERVKWLVGHPLFSGSMVMVVGNNGVNAVNYVYHLLMGRMLGPAAYGDLAAVISLLALVGMVPASLGLVVVKMVAGTKDKGELGRMMGWVERVSGWVGVGVAAVVVAGSVWIGKWLNLSSFWLAGLAGAAFLFLVPSQFFRAALQGLLRFGKVVGGAMAEAGVKLVGALVAVYLGWSVKGVVGALMAAAAVGYFLNRYFLQDVERGKRERPDIGKLAKFSGAVLVNSVATTALLTVDVMWVKHFFAPFDAGVYAAMSTLGKIIFYGAMPVGAVMFPIISRRYAQGAGYAKVLWGSLGLSGVMAVGLVGIYYLFPEMVIRLLYGSAYLGEAGLLVWFGVFMACFVLAAILLNFYLSIERTRAVGLAVAAAVGQSVGIWVWHGSLREVIWVSVAVAAGLLVGLLGYLNYVFKKT